MGDPIVDPPPEAWECGACHLTTTRSHFYEDDDGVMRHRLDPSPGLSTALDAARLGYDPLGGDFGLHNRED